MKRLHASSPAAILGLLAVAGLGLAVASADSPKKPSFKTRSLEDIANALVMDGAHDEFIPSPPVGFTIEQVLEGIPKDNPMTRAKVELGRQLYFDPRLSKDGTISCASCHHPAAGYGDGDATSLGIRGQRGGRNAPTVINRLFSHIQFWDGRAPSLEAQSLGPIENPIEMGNTLQRACATVESIPGYRLQFLAVFGSPKVTPDKMAKAMAAFERSVTSGDSPYDRFDAAKPFMKLDAEAFAELDEPTRKRGEQVLAAYRATPMSESAVRGMDLFFGKASCSLCHTGANFTDELYWNLGVGMEKDKPDLGRFVVSGVEKDKGAFKTPTLRNIADTGPYMHDGSQKTLMEVVEWYDKGGHKNKWLSERVKPLGLSAQDKADIVAFMQALSGEVAPITEPALPR
jgi:cytochrome c peroxidase